MNFDNKGIVSETFLRQRWVLLLVDGAIYFTETFYKWHCITMRYTTLPQKYWNYTKINACENQEVWTLVGKTTKFLDQMGIRLIGHVFFYIGRVMIFTVFPWQLLLITQGYCLFCCKNHRSTHWKCSVKERFLKNLACNFIIKRLQHRCFLVKLAKFLRTSIFKNTCERLLLQDITEKNNSSISFTKLLGLYNYYNNPWDLNVSFILLCSYSFWKYYFLPPLFNFFF